MTNITYIMNQCQCLNCYRTGHKSWFPYKDFCSDKCKTSWVESHHSSDDSSDSTYECPYCQSNTGVKNFVMMHVKSCIINNKSN
jgi:hypothetical protein